MNQMEFDAQYDELAKPTDVNAVKATALKLFVCKILWEGVKALRDIASTIELWRTHG